MNESNPGCNYIRFECISNQMVGEVKYSNKKYSTRNFDNFCSRWNMEVSQSGSFAKWKIREILVGAIVFLYNVGGLEHTNLHEQIKSCFLYECHKNNCSNTDSIHKKKIELQKKIKATIANECSY